MGNDEATGRSTITRCRRTGPPPRADVGTAPTQIRPTPSGWPRMMRAGRFQLRHEDRDRPVRTSHGQAGAAYDPVSGNNDNGLEVRQVLDYGQKQGYADDQGNRYKTGTYISIEPANWQALRECCYLFEVVTMGFQVPQSAMDQFNAGQ